MKPDWKKCDEFWKDWGKIRADKFANGWDGNPNNHGRDWDPGCGHVIWAGWGVSDAWLRERRCDCCAGRCEECE